MGNAQQVQLLNQKGGTLEFGMNFADLKRQFIVHLPPAYQSQPNQSFPVVFMLHGGGGSGRKYYNISGWKELGDQEGIITVFPT